MQELAVDVLEKAAQGDLKAFEHIYKDCASFVYTVALRMVHKREDAQEITQDVFVSVYKNLKHFEFRSSFKTWLYRITVNTALNRCKRNHRQKTVTLDDHQMQEVSFENPSLKSNVIGEDLVAHLLSCLNLDQRACVVLRNVEGLSYEEIAKSLNININTVRSRLKRAREQMKDFFKKRGDPYDM
ncbi:MAG: RNA polymerase sigma factor [Candidatus Omnitrophota bacterium]